MPRWRRLHTRPVVARHVTQHIDPSTPRLPEGSGPCAHSGSAGADSARLPRRLTRDAFPPAPGNVIATGGGDGKLKLWSPSSGFCFVTFTEHVAPVTGVAFVPHGRALVSASLDGTARRGRPARVPAPFTRPARPAHPHRPPVRPARDVWQVRAFDTLRYRNFQTFVSPTPAQFTCVAVDPSGEIVTAGSRDTL